ncbi:MFS transporter [Larsenimonas salina]|uniref:MFS transporter n=1 Tax=Larsenimonas salina TaxID=1295565 RepID=UPI002074855B|nr:MFS transporter [Larsenimonas salina]MCM5704500.1 MFS transporter [Larsenimonas salina]
MTAWPQRVMVAVLLGTATVSLSNSMLNPALTTFMRAFDIGAGQAGGVLSAFMIAMVLAMPLTGYLSARLGRRRLYLAGMTLFIAGSLIGVLSLAFWQVLLARAVQGAASGLVIPLSLPLLFKVFPSTERGRISGLWASVVMLIPAIGPLCGALLIEHLHWRVLFGANLPLAAGACWMAGRCLPHQDDEPAASRFDAAGFALIAGGLAAVLGGGQLMTGAHVELGGALLLLGAGLSMGFIYHQRRTSAPLLPLSVFAHKDFRNGVVVVVLQTLGMFTSLVLVPLLIQVVMEKSALWTGLALLATAVSASLVARYSGRWLDRYGPRALIATGTVLTTLSLSALAGIGPATPVGTVVALMAVRGVGVGLSYMPATTVALTALPDAMTTQGSAITNMVRRIVASLGVIAVTLLIDALPARGLPLSATLDLLFSVIGAALLLALPCIYCLTPTPLNRTDARQANA